MSRFRHRIVATFLVWTLVLSIAVPPATMAEDAPSSGPGIITVGFAAGADPAVVHGIVGLQLPGLVIADSFAALQADLVEVVDVQRALALYRAQPGVLYAELPVRLRLTDTVTPASRPTDPLATAQYNLSRIRAFEAYATVFGERHPYMGLPPAFSGVPIAIVDSGVDVAHPDLLAPKANVLRCVSFLPWPFTKPGEPPVTAALPGCEDTLGHGTHVAGLAAAWTDNANGIAAPAVTSPIIAVKVFWSLFAFDWEISKGIVYAADAGAKVISMSFGANSRSKLISGAISYAEGKDAITVAAAGNDGDGTRSYPACDADLAVGATAFSSRTRASFSSYGCVNIAAPGEFVLSTLPGGTYGPLDGTSMATPQVAGVAALLRSLGAGRNGAVSAILNTAQPAGANVGRGEVDMHAAVHKVLGR